MGYVHLRQVVLVAADLDATLARLHAALGVTVCFRDPSVAEFGLENALMPVGDRFIEVVSPLREGTAAGRHLERRGGDGGYMLMVEVEDIAAERERLTALGVRLVWEGNEYSVQGMHLHPADIGAAILSMDRPDPPGSWGWAGTAWETHPLGSVAAEIVAAELQAQDPAGLASRWAEVLDRKSAQGPATDTWTIALDRGSIRVVPDTDGRGDGLRGFDILALDRSRAGEVITTCGVRVHLV